MYVIVARHVLALQNADNELLRVVDVGDFMSGLAGRNLPSKFALQGAPSEQGHNLKCKYI